MTISIWRYSHLTLAISSSLFILIAAITGIILAIEPISNQLKPYAVQNLEDQSLSKTIAVLEDTYDEVISIKIDENNFVRASVITKKGDNENFYINPFSGKRIEEKTNRKLIYKWSTNLHRSLFLKSTGRFIVGLFSLLLALITITGSILIIKRQGGIKRFFSKIIKEDFEQYYHIIFGRLTIIPILIITLTGVYLSLEKFSLLPDSKVTHNYTLTEKNSLDTISIKEFPIFKSTSLDEIKSLEYPFSEDEEDYFFLKTKNKELIIHQYSGKLISNQNLSLTSILSDWSLILHTGRGTIIWSLVLMLSCFAILFFIYSGLAISIKRRQQNNNLLKNNFHKDNAKFIILVGSETGSTNLFANSLYNAFLKAKKTVYIDSLNNYTDYKSIQHLIILTATYGNGEPPINANQFLEKFRKTAINIPINYAVVGFGSLAYSKFCQFAIEVDNELKKHENFTSIIPINKINNQSFTNYKNWGLQLSKAINIQLELKQESQKIKKQQNFTIVERSALNKDNTYTVRIKPLKKTPFVSGDLLSIRPIEDNIERLYSIGKIDKDIILSIKKHDYGICSNMLLSKPIHKIIKAKIVKNKEFHCPKKNKSVVLIANGTGIAPFLGMLNKHNSSHLFLGLRTSESQNIYSPYLNNMASKNIHITYSQEQQKEYVQDLILRHQKVIVATLKEGGIIMICGSIAMMKGVFNSLEKITSQQLNCSLEKFKKQIKTDCY